MSAIDQTQTPLLSTLQACSDRIYAPFHTPGHKQGRGASQPLQALLGKPCLRADLPELPELDNLFAPQGVIQAAQELAAAAFGAEQTWFLANGSTCGVIAAMLATCNPGEKIILPRNIHQSAISGLILTGAVPIFVQPEYDPVLDLAHSITPVGVAAALQAHPDAKAVMMVYPTYYGVGGDVAAIAHLCHQHAIPLLVDEAHGAHFAFHPDLPIAALAAGADLSIQSTHKTLSALTQAAMLHVRGDRVNRHRLSQSLALVQSTSPNYLLLASLDAARHQMAAQGRELLDQTLTLAEQARFALNQLPGLSTLSPEQAGTPGFISLDRTRLTVTVSGLGITGFEADAILHRLGVTCELPSLQHLTFIFSPGNREEDVERLIAGFQGLLEGRGERGKGEGGKRGKGKRGKGKGEMGTIGEVGEIGEIGEEEGMRRARDAERRIHFSPLTPHPSPLSSSLSPRNAFFAATETVAIAQAINCISAETVCPYPPGIPILLPGEMITEAAIAHLQTVLAAGGIISGCSDPSLKTLKIVKQA